ncbi:MAG: MFS transporter, partial [Chitinophagaceae bacterium]
TNVGATLMPLILPLFVLNDGTNWRYSFFITFGLSVIWVILWWRTYKGPEVHRKVSEKELQYILSDSVKENIQKIPWGKVLPVKETWAFAVAKITDSVWWFYLFWGSIFLHDKFNLQLKGLALPLIIIYVMADAGSIFGGWLSSAFIKKGWAINKARKTTMLICAIIILPVIFATQTDDQWISVLLIGLAAGGHQAWSANIFTLVSDVFPKKATASVVGIGGMVGAAASILAFFVLGHILDNSTKTGFFFAFLIAGSMYLICLLIVHLIMPKMIPLNDDLKHVEIEAITKTQVI